MKIVTENTEFRCTDFIRDSNSARFILPDTQPETLGDTVELRQDDGTVLRTDTVADYARHTIDGTVLVLTNEPEPVPEDDPPPSTEPDALTQTQLAVSELAETEAAHDLENKLAIAELAETLLGGTSNG